MKLRWAGWLTGMFLAIGGFVARHPAAAAAEYGPRVLVDFSDGTEQGCKGVNSQASVSRDRAFGKSRYSLKIQPGQWGANFAIPEVDLSRCRTLKFQLWGDLQPGKQKLWPQLWINGNLIQGWIGPDNDGGLAAGKWAEVVVDVGKHRDVKSLSLQIYDAQPLYVGQVWGDNLPPARASGKATGDAPPASAESSSPSAAGPPQEIRVAVDESSVLWRLPEAYHGTNFVALWNKTGDSPGAVKAVSQLHLSLVRFPGGVPAQWYNWQEPTASGWTVLTPQRAWKLAEAAGAAMVFQTNTATRKEDTNKDTGKTFRFDNSPEHQARWTQACKAQGIGVAFWEIGNEPEMDAPDGHKSNQEAVYAWYNDVFAAQAKAIKRAYPKARIMGPAATNTWFWWAQGNLVKFLKAHGNRQGSGLVDALSLHWYPDGGAAPWEQKRGAAQEWEGCMDFIRQTIREYDTRQLPLYITEWNWGGGDKNDSNRTLANALGCADCVGMFLRTGVSGHTHFCLQRIQRGWGVLAGGGDDRRADDEPSPTYFALALAGLLSGEVLATRVSADEKSVLSAYATRNAEGEVRVMLINKSSRPLSVQLAVSPRNSAGRGARMYTVQGTSASLDDEEVLYNGQRSPKPARDPLPPPRPLASSELPRLQRMPPYSIVTLCLPR